MITDKLLMFSEAQAVTASAASTDVIDLGPIDGTRRDIGVGEPLEFWATVNTTATAAGAATLNVQLQTSRITPPGPPSTTAALWHWQPWLLESACSLLRFLQAFSAICA